MLFDEINFLSENTKNKSNLKVIKSSVTSGKLSHAYLFAGNDMDCLSDIALLFAASVNCEKKGCGKCRVCSNTVKGIYENLLIVEPEGSILTMDKVLQIQKFVSTSAYTEGKKICIIREADLMNREAANRILKV
ncbi:MAG: hypothetical protein FJW66_04975, partial [Actinobacteria bacterium]|nr:hypothetical protein [Actinomycetota bacterium]